MSNTRVWLLWIVLEFIGKGIADSFNVTNECNKPVFSTFTSNLTTEIVTNCKNGVIPWNVPMRYLEIKFLPPDLDFSEGYSVCIESISNNETEIIDNVDGVLTWLPFPKPGNETCTTPVIGIITVAFKGPDFPKTFAVFIHYKIVRKRAPDEVHFIPK